ncbi:MAG: 2-hydroxyacyl-CoA dehydratase [Candidatus Abyssobacteria bacterium SURF_5]|uniref:2-hydroxyacyl-CoA dehydratase n=1 Tax=Abyssobacteria bacterium (strain SURF_5) TaxID=2093360 RepID=A0A3A4NRX4_ABYX5|nr:MAG: 2-hydroxyacyl-CoA dehydratase [Candidatus Abyssubacteria bacterium SURF_5]
MKTDSAQKPVIGWFCTYTPEELILAAGLESRRILGDAAGMAAADTYLHPNLCAFVRACFGSLLNNPNSFAGVVGIDSCDAMRRLFDACRHFLPVQFSHILALPHEVNEDAVQFFHAELQAFTPALRTYSGNNLNDDNLLRAIAITNETRLILSELDELRRAPTGIVASQYYRILRQSMASDKKEFNRAWRGRLQQLRESNPASREGARVVLSGGVLDDMWIVETIEAAGGHVVADDLCCGSRYFGGLVRTDGDPLLQIAERYIRRLPCARMNTTGKRIDHLLELVRQTNATGLIYYSVKFCDPHTLDWVMIQPELQRMRIPALRCEADYSPGNREQIRTRIEAFLEMLS